MAGDWMMMRLDLDEDPAVMMMANRIKMHPLDVVGRLWRVWSWANRQLRDGYARSVTRSNIDSMVGVTGFADAMITVGWLEEVNAGSGEDASGIRFPKFDRWNSKSAKDRGLSAERMRKKRERDVAEEFRECYGAGVTKAQPEKRREEERREENTEDKGAPLNHPKDGSFQGNQTENRAHHDVCPETAPGGPLTRFELTPEGLSQLWTIERRGAPGAKEEPRYLADEIREAIRMGADPEQLQVAIRSRDRDHGEQWWQFKRREIENKRAGPAKAKETAMERGRRLAEKAGALKGGA